MTFRFYHHLSCVMVGAALLGGCAGHSDFMTKAPSSYASTVKADLATIVFFRDSALGFAVNFAILDQSANFLGDAVARSDFSLQLPPGRYFFVAKGGEGTDAVQAEVAAGSAYYVRVVPRMGVWQAGVELDPIKPGEPEWPQLSSWLEKTNHLAPLVPKAPLRLSDSSLPDWAAKAWSALSPSERVAHTLAPTDGLAFAKGAAAVGSPAVVAAY
jgi:hypothetical protein